MKKSSVLGLRVFTSLFLVLFVFAQPLLAIESLEVRDEVPMIEEDISEDILEEGLSDPEEIAKPTPVWNVSGNTAVTTKDVVLGEVYIAPQNSGVTVTFTRLPDVSSTLSVTEILLTDEEVVATGAVSNVAYDISTGMVDGTFEYDLTLPNTGDDSKVVYAENRSGLLSDVNEVSNVVENGDILKVSGLDHFTVFVVVPSIPVGITEGVTEVNNNCTAVSVGSNNLCYDTIQEAINASSNGDTIYVKAGTYNENVLVNKTLELESDSSAIISPSNGPAVTITADNVVIRGFSITHTVVDDPMDLGVLIQNPADHTRLVNNTINGNSVGIELYDSHHNTINDNTLSSNFVGIYFEGTTDGTHIESGQPYYSLSNNNVISNNTITNSVSVDSNSGFAIYLDAECNNNMFLNNTIGSNAKDGIYFWKASSNTVTGNNIVNNGGAGIHFMGSRSNIISENTISGSNTGLLFRASGWPQGLYPIENNSIFNNEVVSNTAKAISSEAGLSIDARNNKWGSSKPSVISLMFDGTVLYDPWYGKTTTQSVTVNEYENSGVYFVKKSDTLNFNITGDPVYGQHYIVGLWGYNSSTGSRDNSRYIGWQTINPTGTEVDQDIAWNMVTTNWMGSNAPGTTIPAGEYLLWVERYYDEGGYVSGSTITKRITVDDTKPTASVVSPLNDESFNGPVQIEVTASDTQTGISEVGMNLYNATTNSLVAGCTNIKATFNGTNWVMTINDGGRCNLAEGRYRVAAWAYDGVRNGVWPTRPEFNIDYTDPDGTISGIFYTVGSNSYTIYNFSTNSNSPMFTGTYSDNIGVAKVNLSLAGFNVDATLDSGTWKSPALGPIVADGTYPLTVTITDIAGNTYELAQNVVIDTKAPTATYTHYNNGVEVLGAQAFVQNLNQLSFTGSYTDFDPSSGLYWDSFVIFDAQADGSFRFSQNGAKAYCSWRKTPNLLTLSGTTYDIDTPVAFTDCVSTLPEGTYYMAHHVYDNATRKDIPTINQFRDVLGLKFTVDTTAPKSQFTGADLSGTYHNSPIVFSGESYDVNGVVSVTLLSRPVGSSGDWTIIETIENPSASNTFEWISNPWTPEDNGRYDIKAEATDQAGNTEHSPMMSNITYDTTAPKVKNVDINIDYFGTYINGQTGFLISVPVSDSLSGIDRNTCEYTIDGAWLPATYAMGNCGMWIDNDRLMDGDNLSISLRVTDKAGNTSTSRVLNREVDKADATSSVNPLNPYYGPLSLPVISGIANDTVSNVTDVKIRMTRSSDGKNWIGRSMWSYLPGLQDVDGTYTWTLNKTLPSMQNGVTYTVTPYAADQVHGFSEGTSESFVWDSQPPQDPTWIRSTSHTSAPSQDRTIDIRFGGATDDLSGVKGYYYSFSQTPETPSQDSRNWLPAWAWRVTSNRLADGVWYFNIRTVDNVGNITSTAHSSAFIVDTTAPQTPVISSPTDEAYFNTQPILNDWNDVYDVNGIHYYRVEYRYDDGHPIPNGKYRITTISERNHIPQEWEQGGVKFRVQAIDNAGNVGPWSEWRHYFYDSIAPDVEITSPTEEYLTGTVEIRGTVTDANPHHYWFVIQNSIGKKVAGPGTVSETDSFTDELLLNWDTTKVPDGDYTIKLEARDSADNKDSGSVHWMIVHVDNQAPIVDISTPSGLIAGTVDVIGSLTDLNPSTYTLEIKNTLTGDKVMLDVDQPTGEFTDQTLYTWDTTLGDDGEYDITFTGEDLAGNSTTIGVTGIIVDNTKPTATVLGTLTFITGDTTPRGINLADNNELDQVCYIIDTNTQQCVNIGGTGFFWDVSSLINTLGVGSHTFTYYVVDKAGNQSDSGVIEGENTNYLANITVNDVPAVAGAATTTLFAQAPVETEEETTTEEENTTEDTQTSEEVKGVEDTDSNDEEEAKNTLPWWAYVLGGGVIISFFLFLIWRRRKDKEEKNY